VERRHRRHRQGHAQAPRGQELRREAQRDQGQAREGRSRIPEARREIQAKYPIPQGGQPPAEGQQAFQALQQEYRVFRESIAGETEKMAAEQFEAAYRELTAAVDTVSEKEQIDLVFRFQPTAEPFEAKSSADAIDRIRARCFLRYPAEIDITAEVMKALNL